MTNEEILEAQKLIADMRNVLSELAGITDADKLTALVLEKVPLMFEPLAPLNAPQRIAIFGSETDLTLWYNDVSEVFAIAEIARRHPEYKETLVTVSVKNLPHAVEVLDRVALKLATQAPESTAP